MQVPWPSITLIASDHDRWMMAHIDIAALLGQLPLFRQLDPPQLCAMSSAAQLVRVPRHQFLFHRGDPATGLHVVAVGLIKLALPSGQGQEKVIEVFGPGQAFGEAVMFLDKPYLVQACAIEDSTLVWIDKQDIYTALDRDPLFARRMLAGLSLRLHGLMQDIENVTLKSAADRLRDFLASLPLDDGHIHLPFSKGLIASKLGLSPETFSRALAHFAEAGVLTVQGRDLVVHQPEKLQPPPAAITRPLSDGCLSTIKENIAGVG
jgi:CRP-like cAMP-binding protein